MIMANCVLLLIAFAVCVGGQDCPVSPPDESQCDDILCLFGQQTDANGCLTCKCIDPCQGITCPAGMKCLAQTELCKDPPCNPMAMAHCVTLDTIQRPEPRIPAICSQQPIIVDEEVNVDTVQGCVLTSRFPSRPSPPPPSPPAPPPNPIPIPVPQTQGTAATSPTIFPFLFNVTTRYYFKDDRCQSAFLVGDCPNSDPAVQNTLTFTQCRMLCRPKTFGVCPPPERATVGTKPCVDACLGDFSCQGLKCCPNRCGTGNVCVQPDPEPPKPIMGCPLRNFIQPRNCVTFQNNCENCQGEQICCQTQDGCGNECTDPVTLEFRFTCPAARSVGGDCVDTCSTDDDCSNEEMCCSNGCGHSCTFRRQRLFDPNNPDHVDFDQDKPGQCPQPVLGREPACFNNCTYDSQCPGDEKCCCNGCGWFCSGSAAYSNILDVPKDRGNNFGFFPGGPIPFPGITDAIQGALAQAAMTAATGTPAGAVPGLVGGAGNGFPGNIGLPVNGFPSNAGTPVNGFPGMIANGFPGNIGNPVNGFPGMGAAPGSGFPGMVGVPGFPGNLGGPAINGFPGTIGAPVNGPFPGFHGVGPQQSPTFPASFPQQPNQGFGKTGTCPSISPGVVGTCVSLCQSDTACPGAMKCCSNGCGHLCTNPVQPAKQGTCPSRFQVYGNRCQRRCSGDSSCPGETKCCSNGCGTFCVKPLTRRSSNKNTSGRHKNYSPGTNGPTRSSVHKTDKSKGCYGSFCLSVNYKDEPVYRRPPYKK